MPTRHATRDCLLRKRTPPSECTGEWRAVGCLRSQVPTRIPHTTLAACFRCCLLNATASLSANSHFWRRVWMTESRDPWGKGEEGKARGAPGKLLGIDGDDSVLLGALSGARFADAGATYSNNSVVLAPLWGRRERPSYTYIHGWNAASALALQKWSRMDAPSPRVLYTSGARMLPTPNDRHYLDDMALRKWWVTNPAESHPRLVAFPRGVKSTTRWHRALKSPLLERVASRKKEDRPTLLFCGCMSLRSHQLRAVKLAALRANGFSCEASAADCGETSQTGAVGSDPYIRRMSEARFTASPRGSGMQNHRDWEALYAGSIPLIDHHRQLQTLYEGLPVVMVQNWSLVTASFLEETWARMASEQWQWSKLYFPYWLDALGITGERVGARHGAGCGRN